MTLAPDREQALRNALPNNYHASIPALAQVQVLAAVLDGQDAGVVSPEMLGVLRHLQWLIKSWLKSQKPACRKSLVFSQQSFIEK
jgi:hypothetical protein